MGYIPDDAKWYLADIVIEHKIEDEPRNVIHINTVLVRASSPERAYARAIKLGQEAEHEYKNTEDKTVRVVFRGLRDLTVIYDKLRSGSELIYQERIGQTEEQVAKLISPKSELAIFEERQKPSKDKPNYMPGSVMEMLKEVGFDDSDIYS
jgi:hypothetical protein